MNKIVLCIIGITIAAMTTMQPKEMIITMFMVCMLVGFLVLVFEEDEKDEVE